MPSTPAALWCWLRGEDRGELVLRTRWIEQSFDPAAFVLRRSMPWSDERRSGLVFVAFGKSYDAFAAQLKRMVGAEDGITDAPFRFSRPVSGAYFWCPPQANGRLDLSALGLWTPTPIEQEETEITEMEERSASVLSVISCSEFHV